MTYSSIKSVHGYGLGAINSDSILLYGPDNPPKLPFLWGSGLPSNTWFLQSTRVSWINSISIGSAVFAALMNVTKKQTDTQTDRPRYSVCSNSPHLVLSVQAIRPNNNNNNNKKKKKKKTTSGRLNRPRHCSKGVQPVANAVCSRCRNKHGEIRTWVGSSHTAVGMLSLNHYTICVVDVATGPPDGLA